MTGWAALGPIGGEMRAILMRGEEVAGRSAAADGSTALAHLPSRPDRVIRIGDGVADRLPAPVLPACGEALPGLVQDSPPDAMGGWVRLQMAGFLAGRKDWDGIICATDGDIRHWVHVSAGEAVSMQSVLTPRLVEALGGSGTPEMDAVADSLSRPERLAAHLRAAEVTGNGAAITGHLIGAELAAARVYWLGQQVAVLAPAPAPVAIALEVQGVPCAVCDPGDLVAPGLTAIGLAFGIVDDA